MPPTEDTSNSLRVCLLLSSHFNAAAVPVASCTAAIIACDWRPTDADKKNKQQEGGAGIFPSHVPAATGGRSEAGEEPSINFIRTGILGGRREGVMRLNGSL